MIHNCDWSQVDAGIYHDFRRSWLHELSRALNDNALPSNYYALIERVAQIVPLREVAVVAGDPDADDDDRWSGGLNSSSEDFYRSRTNAIAVRHEMNDSLAAIIYIGVPACHSVLDALAELPSESRDFANLVIVRLCPDAPFAQMMLSLGGTLIEIPGEETYRAAFVAVPRRW